MSTSVFSLFTDLSTTPLFRKSEYLVDERRPKLTCISDYAAKVFGFATFGKVYGLIICMAGLFNFSQSALDALTHKVFGNNPVPVNLMLLVVAVCVGVALVIYVHNKSNTISVDVLREEAEEAEERLMPGAETGVDWAQNGNGSRTYGTIDGVSSSKMGSTS